MKKLFYLFIYLLLLMQYIHALNDTEIKNILVNSSWEKHIGADDYCIMKMTFNEDGRCKYVESFISFYEWNGTFIVKNGKILINIENHEEIDEVINNKIVMILEEPIDSINYYYFIKNENTSVEKLWSINNPIPPMKERKWNGYDIYTIAPKKMIVEENLKMRQNPDIKSRRVRITTSGYEEETYYFPKGTSIIVTAISKNKQKIGEWDNYWYLVEYKGKMFSGVTYYESPISLNNKDNLPNKVWVYGEFIK